MTASLFMIVLRLRQGSLEDSSPNVRMQGYLVGYVVAPRGVRFVELEVLELVEQRVLD